MKDLKWWQELIFVVGYVTLSVGVLWPVTVTPGGPGSDQIPALVVAGATCLILLWPLRIFSRVIVISTVLFFLFLNNSSRELADETRRRIFENQMKDLIKESESR